MATINTKFGKLYAEKAPKESAINLGFTSEQGSGFWSVPLGKRELIHAASLIGAASLLRGLTRKKKDIGRAQKNALRQMRQTRKRLAGKPARKRG